MKFTKNELLNAAEILFKSGNKDAKKMGYALADIMNDPDCGGEYDIINREHYFATVLWSLEDIKGGLISKGFSDDLENILKVRKQLSGGALEDCSDGWECIFQAIDRIESELE